MVNLVIDGKAVQADENTSILDAAKTAGVNIPTLCALKGVIEAKACRLCVVEIEGEEQFAPACATVVREGLVVKTNTLPIIEARRQNLELILSQHNTSCTTCVRNTNCELQTLASEMNIPDFNPTAPMQSNTWPKSQHLQRDESKCIMCMRCVGTCDRIQSCNVWDMVGTGSYARVDVREGKSLEDVTCALCGQCIVNCPVGALSARDDTRNILEAIADPETIVVANIAPAVRAAWGEQLDLAGEKATEPHMVAAAKAIGFNFVFDTDFAADLTIMEEGTELLDRIGHAQKHQWPMFTSCCPGWIRFVKQNYPEFLPNLSTAKSPHQMLGAVTKTYFAREQNIDPKKIFMVSIMPCVAKKYEASVLSLTDSDAVYDIDAVITTREFVRLIKTCSIDVASLEEAEWDKPFGLSTGAGVIFGRSGGVMEAALRSAAFLITGKELPLEATATHNFGENNNPWIEKSFQIGEQELSVAIVSGLANARMLLDMLKEGRVSYDFIEVMACPGGCINGGGQPIVSEDSKISRRTRVLNTLDQNASVRLSHRNADVQELYKDFLEKPNSSLAHHLLHTDQADWKLN